jgi:hypothetical protein
MTPNNGYCLFVPGVADMSNHHPKLRIAKGDLVQEKGPSVRQRSTERKGRPLVDQQGHFESL